LPARCRRPAQTPDGGFAHVIELEGFDDRFDEFHALSARRRDRSRDQV
jgi:hypothetical protein